MIILLNDARSGTNGVIRMHIIFKCHCLSVNRHVKKVAVCHIYRALFTRVISGSAVKADSLLSFLYLAGHDFSLCGEDLNHRHKSHSNQWQNGESQYDSLMSKLNAIRLLAIRRCNKLVGVKIGNDFFYTSIRFYNLAEICLSVSFSLLLSLPSSSLCACTLWVSLVA